MLDAMNDAITSSRSLEITTAVKDAMIEDQAVKAGEYIAMIDGKLISTNDNELLIYIFRILKYICFVNIIIINFIILFLKNQNNK